MTKKYHYEILLDSDSTAAKLLRFVGNNKIVLELGCASGCQSKVLTEHFGCKVTGVEIDAASIQMTLDGATVSHTVSGGASDKTITYTLCNN